MCVTSAMYRALQHLAWCPEVTRGGFKLPQARRPLEVSAPVGGSFGFRITEAVSKYAPNFVVCDPTLSTVPPGPWRPGTHDGVTGIHSG